MILTICSMTACTRDTETSLRARLSQWFYIGNTSYFMSNRQCTGAMVSVNVSYPRDLLQVQDNVISANYVFNTDVVMAVRIDGLSPAEVIDLTIQNGSSGLGRQALSAAALSGSCFEDNVVAGFAYEALTRRGALLAFDRESRGLMVLDPTVDRLFFMGSDVW